MLFEYALTPHVLADASNEDAALWRECLRSIGNAIYPEKETPCPFIFSGLHGDGSSCTWLHQAKQAIEHIEDHKTKDIARRLLGRIKDLLVLRSPVTEWPGDDEPPWIEEARGARTVEELTDILCSLATTNHAELEVSPLTSVTEPGYWRGSRQTLTPTGTMAEQAALLRPILVHSPTLILSLPYGNLRPFAWELIQSAFNRPTGFPVPHVHIYNEAPGGAPEKTLNYFRTTYPAIADTGRVHWHFWPSNRQCYRERVLLGSIERKPLNGRTVPGARWGVAMTHCPGEGDESEAEPTTWSLLSDRSLLAHQDKLTAAISRHDVDSHTL